MTGGFSGSFTLTRSAKDQHQHQKIISIIVNYYEFLNDQISSNEA